MFVVEASRYCNNNCIFCTESRERPVKNYVTADLKEAAKYYQGVDFAVGEPTINPNLPDYIKMAKEAGFKELEITTNGRMLAVPGYAEKLARAGISRFKISIHGSSPRVHDALTRTPGSFRQTAAGLLSVSRLKRGYGLTIDTLTTVTKLNYRDIPDLLTLLLKFPVDTLVLNIFDPMGEAKSRCELLMPKYSEVEKVFHGAVKRLERVIKRRGVELCISLPICILSDDIKKYYSNYEVLAFKGEGENIEESATQRGKVFTDVCQNCSLKGICDGIWEDYIKIFGKEEFRPQKGDPKKLLRKG